LKSISVLGTLGVPAAYGGFETLADNLVCFNSSDMAKCHLSVYCSGSGGAEYYQSASLRYVNLGANGISSIFYDIVSLFSAVKRKDDVILLLGVSGAIALPIVRLLTKARIVTNIDGVEWKREKWSGLAKAFLRISERVAVRFSHTVIADNQGIADHVKAEYGADCEVVAYGGDHAVAVEGRDYDGTLPEKFVLGLCRIEPENNVEMILQAFSQEGAQELVFIGNWASSEFGSNMRGRFGSYENIHLLDPIYDTGVLKTIRSSAFAYVHGHSAGGTNPSLVEMMHFELPIFAFDCSFNRYTTNHKALYFSSSSDLAELVAQTNERVASTCASEMKSLAIERYTWARVGQQYFDLLLR
jgi:glycosyltransferase involved in cell wall biosynthesis